MCDALERLGRARQHALRLVGSGAVAVSICTVDRHEAVLRLRSWVGSTSNKGNEMRHSKLMFFGFEIELAVEAVLARDDGGPRVCAARDGTAQHWLIVRVDDDPDHLAWLCVPVSKRAMEAVLSGRGALKDVIRHSPTGTVDLVAVEHGRAVPDRCLLCASIAEHLIPAPDFPELVAA